MKLNWIVASLVLISLTACSEMDKVDEMHDATVKMSNTTDEMKKNTSDLDAKTEQLKEVTDELYDSLRQGDALQARRAAYDSILKAPTLFKKTAEATKYFMSFEFQLWNHMGQDQDEDKRDILGQQAALEFFMEIEELADRDGSVHPLVAPDVRNINSRDNLRASFNAMAISMDKINRKQTRELNLNKNHKPMSMYSMMEEALLAPRDVPQKGYVREILAHEEKAIQLLQGRYNMFQMMFVDTVTKIGDKNIVAQGKMVFLGWDFNLDSLSATQLEYLQTEALAHALEAKKFLIKLGKAPKLNPLLKRLMKNMRVKMKPLQKGQKTVIQAQQQQLLDLIRELQK
ncbi:MAG: hypothetical protein ACKOX6_11805 [Bdellovibrio sp.]